MYAALTTHPNARPVGSLINLESQQEFNMLDTITTFYSIALMSRMFQYVPGIHQVLIKGSSL